MSLPLGLAGQVIGTNSSATALTNLTAINSVSSINSTFIGLGRNRIINGDMVIDQRNEGALVTVNTGALFYGCDRFWGAGTVSAGVFKTQRVSTTPPTGFNNYTHVTVTTADASPAAASYYLFGTILEGYSVRDFLFGNASAKTITVSFWVRSNLTGTFGGSVANATNNRSYTFNYTINSTNTWEQKAITLVGDVTGTWNITNAQGFVLYLDLGSGSTYQGTVNTWASSLFFTTSGANKVIASTSNTWDITGVQVEIGSQATSFEYAPMPILLTQCQRYYEKSYPIGTVPGSSVSASSATRSVGAQQSVNVEVYQNIDFNTSKRASPTITIYTATGTSGQATSISTTGVSTNVSVTVDVPIQSGFSFYNSTNNNPQVTFLWTASSDF